MLLTMAAYAHIQAMHVVKNGGLYSYASHAVDNGGLYSYSGQVVDNGGL